ncbi:MAG: hypothetical protein RI573_01845 [Balneolaceae bacterium]|nr:hypothetical protein [Balneolaceae bacterium]
MSEQIWRFNVDHTWENFSYLIEDQARTKNAENPFLKNKYKRSCLYYCEVAIESLLNRIMRDKLQNQGEKEKKIYGKLKKTGFYNKLTEWPEDVFDAKIRLTDKELSLFEIFEAYYRLRNSLTHPKHYDHSIYESLKDLNVDKIREAGTRVLLEIFILKDGIFPYWLTGWNFVGFNGDDNNPFLSNNSQFLHALSRMGFINIDFAWTADKSNEWQSNNMSCFEDLCILTKKLNEYPYTKEKVEDFNGPILTKNWWEN